MSYPLIGVVWPGQKGNSPRLSCSSAQDSSLVPLHCRVAGEEWWGRETPCSVQQTLSGPRQSSGNMWINPQGVARVFLNPYQHSHLRSSQLSLSRAVTSHFPCATPNLWFICCWEKSSEFCWVHILSAPLQALPCQTSAGTVFRWHSLLYKAIVSIIGVKSSIC